MLSGSTVRAWLLRRTRAVARDWWRTSWSRGFRFQFLLEFAKAEVQGTERGAWKERSCCRVEPSIMSGPQAGGCPGQGMYSHFVGTVGGLCRPVAFGSLRGGNVGTADAPVVEVKSLSSGLLVVLLKSPCGSRRRRAGRPVAGFLRSEQDEAIARVVMGFRVPFAFDEVRCFCQRVGPFKPLLAQTSQVIGGSFAVLFAATLTTEDTFRDTPRKELRVGEGRSINWDAGSSMAGRHLGQHGLVLVEQTRQK